MIDDLYMMLHEGIQIVRGAGDILREGYARIDDLRVTYKGDTDPVTEYDHRSESFIVGALRQAFPSHRIVGEEGGDYVNPTIENPKSEIQNLVWQVDPLDGTVNFAHGFPAFSVSMGLLRDGVPVLGIVFDPMRDELFSAVQGGGARLNNKPIRVSSTAPLARALLNTGFPYDRRTSPDNNFDAFLRFQVASQEVRRIGSAALDLCMVACGRMDGYWEMKIKPHDISAGIVIVREAGGVITDYAGGDDMLTVNQIIASNGQIHDEMLAILNTSA
jgi:myo-inositol-1(or 4)-monophosphatase